MAEKDGGPAFPIWQADMNVTGGPGLTKHEWFAGQALIGILYADELARAQVNPGGRYSTALEVAKAAHAQADAMLEKPEEGKDG